MRLTNHAFTTMRLLLPIVTAVAISGAANASTITAVYGPVSGSGSLTPVVSTPAPGNNNVPGLSPNTIDLTENITGLYMNDGFVLGLTFGPTQTSTEYTVTKTVTNNTGIAWNSFSVGVGCDPSTFTPRASVSCFGSNDPLTMDYDLPPTISGVGTGSALLGTQGAAYFQWLGLNVAPGSSITLTFNMDVGSFWSGSASMFQNAGSSTPEPATLALTGLGLVALGFAKRRRAVRSAVRNAK